jgi:pimeloyl-ACP methyl ester carboxylesterase
MICELPGISIYFEVNVVDALPPVLFLHAALSTLEEMRGIRRLFQDRSIILLDLPGHGKTKETIDSITTASVADIIVQFLDRLKIPQVDIVGYSLGGYVGLELAISHAAKVRSVITHAMKFYWTNDAIESTISTFSKAQVPERAIRATESLIRDLSRKQLSPDEIKNSKIPILLTTGEKDEFVTPREVSKLWQEIGSRNTSLAIFPGAGHSLRKLPLEIFEQTAREFWASL